MKVETIGAFEAKTRLSELLEKVQRGQVFQITKRGKAVAELRMPSSDADPNRAAAALSARFATLRKRVKPGPSARELVAMGRRG